MVDPVPVVLGIFQGKTRNNTYFRGPILIWRSTNSSYDDVTWLHSALLASF